MNDVIITLDGSKTIPRTKTLDMAGVRLKQGINYIDTFVYERIKKQKIYSELTESGALKVIEPEEKKTQKSKAKAKVPPKEIEISSLSLEDAKKLAASENNKRKLKKWLNQETSTQNRKDVIAILNANLTGESNDSNSR